MNALQDLELYLEVARDMMSELGYSKVDIEENIVHAMTQYEFTGFVTVEHPAT